MPPKGSLFGALESLSAISTRPVNPAVQIQSALQGLWDKMGGGVFPDWSPVGHWGRGQL